MILDCGHEPSAHTEHTTGYGEDVQGKKYCYACCADRQRKQMIEDGTTSLYLTRIHHTHLITDWADHLVFKPYYVQKGKHNIARVRYDAWFRGPDGFVWHGVQYGDNTQIIHCKRTKRKVVQ